ncbi:hypothetical protein JCM16358_12720 [Halanaerocella petrolearia]
MKKVMLVLFSFENLDQVINRTFKLVEPEDELYVAGFIEEELPDSLSNLISDIGFLGKKVTNDVESTIVEQYQDRANKNLDSIAQQGEETKSKVNVELLAKDELSDIKQQLRAEEVDHLIINYTNDQFISEEVLVYPLDQILQEIDIPYELYYDGELDQEEKIEE